MGLFDAYRELRTRAPEVSGPALALRVLLWKANRMMGRKPIVRLHGRSRMRLEAGPREHGIRAGIYLFRDAYEPSVRHAIDRFVGPGERCYDIGANLGLWTLRMAERAGPAGHVTAFEPVPATAGALAEAVRLSGHGNVEIVQSALGDQEGVIVVHVPDDVGRTSLAAETENDEAIEAPIRRLDDVWRAQGRPAIGFVKIDVEGAEPLVLTGAAEMLETLRPIVACEVNPEKLGRMGFVVADVLIPFSELGYRALCWDDARRTLSACAPDPDATEVQDFVFVPGDSNRSDVRRAGVTAETSAPS